MLYLDKSSFDIMINYKNQIVKISKVHNIFKALGDALEEQHEVIEFEIDELKQAREHTVTSTDPIVNIKRKTNIFSYEVTDPTTLEESKYSEEKDAPTFGGIKERRKVVVKDGISQHHFILQNK